MEYYIVTVWILRGKLTRVKLILHFTIYRTLTKNNLSSSFIFNRGFLVEWTGTLPEGTRVERWFRISNIFVTRICTVLSCILFSHEYGIENRSIELYKFDSKRYSRIILRSFPSPKSFEVFQWKTSESRSRKIISRNEQFRDEKIDYHSRSRRTSTESGIKSYMKVKRCITSKVRSKIFFDKCHWMSY